VKIIKILVVLVVFSLPSASQTLQRRVEPPFIHETCYEHIMMSRHWFLDAAKVTKNMERRRWLLAEYKLSAKSDKIDLACQDKKTLAEFDWALAGIRLQTEYDREDKLK
jgi:hypothetical protein